MAKASRVGEVVDTRDVQVTLTNDEAVALATLVANHVDTYGAPDGSGVRLVRGLYDVLRSSGVNVRINSDKFKYSGGTIAHKSSGLKY